MSEKEKSVADGKLYLDENLKIILTKGGGDGRTAKILINRFSFLVCDPKTDYKDLESSLQTLLKDVQSEIEHQSRKKADEQPVAETPQATTP